MKVNVQELMQHPYKLTLELTETELGELQDVLHTVTYLARQFTDHQRELCGEIEDRISEIWRD